MINIEQVHRIRERYPYRCAFPAIDFKFQNTGAATAFLWQFVVTVLHAEVDRTPVLGSKIDVVDNELRIEVVNNGWGAAHKCHIQVDEPILDGLFTDADLQYTGTLQSGDSKIFRLTKELAKPDQFKVVSEEFESLEFFLYRSREKEIIHGIRLAPLRLMWAYEDEKGMKYEKEEEIRIGERANEWLDIFLTQNGFLKGNGGWLSGAVAPSSATYCIIIDPSKGCHERTYSISHKIPSGDIERFHIVVGSPMSCHLRVRFKFLIDQSQVAESSVFEIDIWNPRNSRWHKSYTDGVQLSRPKLFFAIDDSIISEFEEEPKWRESELQ